MRVPAIDTLDLDCAADLRLVAVQWAGLREEEQERLLLEARDYGHQTAYRADLLAPEYADRVRRGTSIEDSAYYQPDNRNDRS